MQRGNRECDCTFLPFGERAGRRRAADGPTGDFLTSFFTGNMKPTAADEPEMIHTFGFCSTDSFDNERVWDGEVVRCQAHDAMSENLSGGGLCTAS